MASGNNIKHFSAADIEKYHKGQLSAKQMHDMEKAAMDDPFLADALEGYAHAGADVSNDIADLRNRLDAKTKTGKIVSIGSPGRPFQLLRVAVLLAFVAGAGILIYQIGFNKKNTNEIAQLKEKSGPLAKDSASPVTVSKETDSTLPSTMGPATTTTTTITTSGSNAHIDEAKPKKTAAEGNLSANEQNKERQEAPDNFKTDDNIVARTREPQPLVVAPATGSVEKTTRPGTEDKFTNKPVSRGIDDIKVKQKDDGSYKDQEERKDVAPAYRRTNAGKIQKQENFGTFGANTFRGQVTDNNRVGVPFAKVTNSAEGVDLYTDARGNFNLTYPDSVLNVQVRSVGYENTNVQLRNNIASNQVILDNTQNSLSEVVVINQKLNSNARNREKSNTTGEPEPADGWEKYDAYLLNNNSLQDETKNSGKPSGTVMLSFEVNKNGLPSNIKVEKSLCSDCDKEAIRLLKEGPKWKRNTKKGRTTIAVPF